MLVRHYWSPWKPTSWGGGGLQEKARPHRKKNPYGRGPFISSGVSVFFYVGAFFTMCFFSFFMRAFFTIGGGGEARYFAGAMGNFRRWGEAQKVLHKDNKGSPHREKDPSSEDNISKKLNYSKNKWGESCTYVCPSPHPPPTVVLLLCM